MNEPVWQWQTPKPAVNLMTEEKPKENKIDTTSTFYDLWSEAKEAGLALYQHGKKKEKMR